MDAKSVRRVSEAFSVKPHYDSKLKRWTLGALSFSVDEVAKMSSLDLRKQLTGDKGVVVQTGKQAISESKDGNTVTAKAAGGNGEDKAESDVDKAAQLLKQRSGGRVEREIAEHKASGDAAKPKRKRAAKKVAKPDVEHVSCVKVTFPMKRKAKRTPEDDAGKVWLPGVGISKWQARQKMIARGDKQAAKDWNKDKTNYLTPAECKDFAKSIFDATDKKVLANPEKYTERAVKYAKEAREAAERLLDAADKAKAAK